MSRREGGGRGCDEGRGLLGVNEHDRHRSEDERVVFFVSPAVALGEKKVTLISGRRRAGRREPEAFRISVWHHLS